MKVRIYATDGTDQLYNNAPENIFEDERAYEHFETQMNRRFDNTFDRAEMYHETNVEMVNRVCDFSRNGVMGQAFLIEAVKHYAEQVIKQGIPEKDPDDDRIPFIAPELWLACAEEWNKEIEAHYKK